MKRQNKGSISTQFLSVTLSIVLVGMLLLATIITYQAASSHVDETLAKVAEQTAHSGDQVNGWLKEQEGYVKSLSIDLAYEKKLSAETAKGKGKKHVEQNDQFFEVYVGVPSGQAFFSSGFEPNYAGGWSAVKRPWYQAAMKDTAVPHITAPYTDVQTGKLCITAAQAIVKDDQVLGVASADILIDYLNDIVLKTDVGAGSYAFITDGEGKLLIHPNKAYGPDAEDNFQSLGAIENGTYENLWKQASGGKNKIKFRGADKKTYFFTHHKIESTGWEYFIAVPTSLVYRAVWVQVGTAAVIFLIVVLIAAFLLYAIMKKIIIKPVLQMTGAAARLADGNTAIELDGHYVGEMALLADSFQRMAQSTKEQVLATERMATGDLTVAIPLRSDQDVMGKALREMSHELRDMMGELNEISTKVSLSSTEVAQGAQTLAEGSTEQASTMDQISQSIIKIQERNEITSQTASDAAQSGANIATIAEEGSKKMTNMMSAVQAISDASIAVGNVIKVIDDIAFQTNILALNAAVEAARAGEHGKGFAVVADEVRNLAGKSADAAKDTSSLISANIEKAKLGLSIAQETAETLTEIISGIGEMAQSMGDLAGQGEDNRDATAQVMQAVQQINLVTQQNSATSQESAASSQEMNEYAESMQRLVKRFQVNNPS